MMLPAVKAWLATPEGESYRRRIYTDQAIHKFQDTDWYYGMLDSLAHHIQQTKAPDLETVIESASPEGASDAVVNQSLELSKIVKQVCDALFPVPILTPRHLECGQNHPCNIVSSYQLTFPRWGILWRARAYFFICSKCESTFHNTTMEKLFETTQGRG